MVSKSRKHARTVKLNSAVNNAIEKAVDARKVAAFTIGAAGVLAGAAFAFGATPAMAAENGATGAKTNPAPVAAGEKPGVDKKAEADKNNQADGKSATDEKTDNNTLKKADKTNNKSKFEQNLSNEKKASTQSVVKTDGKAGEKQVEQNKIADQNTASTESVDKKVTDSTAAADNTDAASSATAETTASAPAKTPARKRTRRALGNTQTDAATSENQERASDNNAANRDPNKINPDTSDSTNTNIEVNENNAGTMPNMYGWGSSDNTYSINGETHTVTFNFAKPKDDGTITAIAIFPAQNNGLNNDKSKRGAEYYSGDPKMHQSFSGNYTFKQNGDGSATLTMSNLFRDGNLNGGAEAYAANRSIFVYVTKKDGTTTIYKTNAFRAATLVPPKTSGSVVLKYNQPLTKEQIKAAITAAANAETARKDKKSVNDQIIAASKANGVNTTVNGKSTQVPDTLNDKLNVESDDAYDKTTFEAINAKKAGDTNSYVAGAKTLNTYMVTDLGFKSQAIPLTVARYDTRIDKPIVEYTDPSKVSDEVKADIKRKLARLNNVSLDQVTINDQGEFTINFAGVDPKDAPKIALRDLVLKKLEEKDISVPANDKATVVYNPLGYSNAELERIKQSILDANKNNKDLDLTSTDQITLSYLTGDTTGAGKANQGISNGQAENKITVKIKTDKAYAEFTSDVKAGKLTRLVDIRKDYNVSWDQGKNKLDGRDSDEGLSWSNDSHTTIIYRYDPTAAKELKTDDIIKLLKATPKDQQAGLRDLTGGEKLDHEDSNGKPRKSHMHYALKDDEPTGELSLGNMSGAYWIGNQKVSHSDEKLGDNQSIAGSYSWDPEAGSVTVAGKKDKIYKARLFVQPYAMTYYKDVYLEQGRNPGNTAKAINIIFVPQTNHKTKDLKTSVEGHATTKVDGKDVPTQSKYYNASADKKEAYDKALQTAKTLYESVKDTEESKLTEDQKAQIDNATINLNKARAELDGPDTIKDGLDKSITEDGTPAEGQQATTGTKASDKYKNVTEPDFKKADGSDDTERNEAAKKAKTAYDEALQAAKDAKANDNATQKDVDAAKAKLDAAREKLNEFTTSKVKLNAAIAEHGKVNTGKETETDPKEKLKTADPAYQNATPGERTAYDNAVKKANDLLADPNASQKEVNEAITALEKAKKALDAKATDKSQLITAEKLTFDNPDKNDASKQSTFYKNALNKKDNGASEQEKQAAKTAVENYDNALQKARDVLKNDKATQAEVNAAKEALTNAEKVLHEKYATDADELTKVLADNFSGYLMPAYFNAFDKAHAGDADAKKAFEDYNDAYQKAKELKRKLEEAKTGGTAPTQPEIDAAKTALEKARTVIDKYATNTSRLSAAVFNDIAIQHSPAYKNVSAADASEEAKAAKKKYDDAVTKLNQALNKQMSKDKQGNTEIPTSNTPDANIDVNNANALDNIQAHAQGEPLDRDITSILKEMNDAIADLNKFATKTDELLKSVNEDDATKQTPAYKNASLPVFQKADSSDADADKNAKAKQAVDKYGEMLNKAKELLKDPNATQAQINEAKKNLDDARKTLLGDPNDQANVPGFNTDTTKLQKSVSEHGKEKHGDAAATEGTVTSDAYRNASDPHFMKDQDGKLVPDTDKNTKAAAAKKAYDEALTKAQELLKKHADANTPQDAKPTQKDVNDALKTLDDARKKLEDNYKTNTDALSAEAAKSTDEGATTPTAGSFEDSPEFKNASYKQNVKPDTNPDVQQAKSDIEAYKKALNAARELLAKKDSATLSERPTQKQINDALETLKNAKQAITDGYKTDTSKLTEAKDYANGDFKKTPEYQNAKALKDDNSATADQDKKGKAKDAVEALDDTVDNSALKKAKAIIDNPTGKTQKEVDAALKTLQDAMDKVTRDYKTNADKLKNEVGDKDDKGKDVIPPFEASVPYKNALAKADAGDNDATTKLKDYNDKLAAAQKIIDQVNKPDPNAAADSKPTQAQVDKALSELKAAKDAITNGFKTDVTALQNEADDKDEHGNAKQEADKFENSTEFKNLNAKIDGDKKPDDLVAYEQALAKAKELIKKNTGKMADPQDPNKEVDVPNDQLPSQKEVDEAQKALKEIKDKILANYKTSPHDLQQEVDKSKNGDTDTSTDVFENTPAFKNATAKGDDASKQALKDYNEKLTAAKTLLDKFDRTTGKPKKDAKDVPTQKQLDDALDALKAAKKKITDEYSTIKYDLRKEADNDGDFTKSPEYQNAQAKGDDASKKALEDYKKALDDANSVLDNPNATQSEVDEALKKLQAAKDKLRDENGTDKSKLQTEADDDAKFRKSLYFIIGNKDDIEAYKKALAEANSVLKDPNATQSQVDEALKKLQAAKYKLNHPFGAGSGSGIGSGYDPNAGNGFAVEANDSQSASVDKSALQVEVNNAVDTSANTAAARAYRQALAEAKRVLADKNATQAQVDEALRKLQAAKSALLNSLRGASGNAGGLAKTGAETGLFASVAAIFAGLGVAGVASRRRKHSNE